MCSQVMETGLTVDYPMTQGPLPMTPTNGLDVNWYLDIQLTYFL